MSIDEFCTFELPKISFAEIGPNPRFDEKSVGGDDELLLLNTDVEGLVDVVLVLNVEVGGFDICGLLKDEFELFDGLELLLKTDVDGFEEVKLKESLCDGSVPNTSSAVS